MGMKVKEEKFTAQEVKELIDSLVKDQFTLDDIEGLVKKLFTPVVESLNKYFKLFHKNLEKMDEKLDEHSMDLAKTFKDGLKDYHTTNATFKKTLDRFEESLMYIMHNIKKNQFLYAHYPDEWVQDYQDIKNGLKKENCFMDKLIKEKK